ncbi:MAG: hypothetical protein U1F48_14020 [Burkholderiales bacterium]
MIRMVRGDPPAIRALLADPCGNLVVVVKDGKACMNTLSRGH